MLVEEPATISATLRACDERPLYSCVLLVSGRARSDDPLCVLFHSPVRMCPPSFWLHPRGRPHRPQSCQTQSAWRGASSMLGGGSMANGSDLGWALPAHEPGGTMGGRARAATSER